MPKKRKAGQVEGPRGATSSQSAADLPALGATVSQSAADLPVSGEAALQSTARRHLDTRQYTALHFIRKHIIWLIGIRTKQGACAVDFGQMTLTQYAVLAPDQREHLKDLEPCESVGDLAHAFQVDPMMITCMLCLLNPLLEGKKQKQKCALEKCALESPEQHPALIAIIEEHKRTYGFPPSPSLLIKEHEKALNGLPRRRFPPAPSPAPGATASQSAADLPASGATASQSAADLPASGAAPSQATAGPLGGPKAPSPLLRANWYKTESATPGQKACECSGNCLGYCPGRYDACKNRAVVNIADAQRKHKPLCAACCCRYQGCANGARRPHGANACDANYGFCTTHYPIQAHQIGA